MSILIKVCEKDIAESYIVAEYSKNVKTPQKKKYDKEKRKVVTCDKMKGWS